MRSRVGALAKRLLALPPPLSEAIEAAAARLRASQMDGESSPPLLFATPCVLVRQLKLVEGTLALSSSALYFLPSSHHLLEGAKERCWDLSRLTEVLSRRYLLQRCALELFLAAGGGFKSIFLSFGSVEMRQEAQRMLMAQQLPAMASSRRADVTPDVSACTHAWQQGALSNFEYLMRLNSLAGRSYSDLTQYPVMPWVLCEYSSEEIDLNNPAVYRELSKPMGALNPSNHARLREQYQVLQETFEEVWPLPKAQWHVTASCSL